MKELLFVTEEDEGFVGIAINISQYQQIYMINTYLGDVCVCSFLVIPSNF